MSTRPPVLVDNPVISARTERYMTVRLNVARTLKSWRESLMAHEWLHPDGSVREPDDLNMLDRDKTLKAQQAINAGEALPRPVMGIGILDNVEIGCGREIFCLVVRSGAEVIDVHIPRSNETEFQPFLG